MTIPPVEERMKRCCYGGSLPGDYHKNDCVHFWYDCSHKEYADGNSCNLGFRDDGSFMDDELNDNRDFDCKYHITSEEIKELIDSGAL